MNSSEEKNLKAQIELYQGIDDANNMILSVITSAAMDTLKKVIEPNMYSKTEKNTFVLTVDEFQQISQTLVQLSSPDNFKHLNKWIEQKYLDPKEEKRKILSILR